MTYEFYLDIKSSKHIHVKTTSWSSIRYFHVKTIPWSLHHQSTRLQPIVDLKQVLGDRLGRLLPDSSSSGMRRGYLDRY